jgi:hypothetical protein
MRSIQKRATARAIFLKREAGVSRRNYARDSRVRGNDGFSLSPFSVFFRALRGQCFSPFAASAVAEKIPPAFQPQSPK